MPRFVFQNRERAELQFDNFTDFRRNFRATGILWQDFLDFANTQEIVFNPVTTKDRLIVKRVRNYMKARFARVLFGEREMYKILNANDPMMREALRVLREKKPIVAN